MSKKYQSVVVAAMVTALFALCWPHEAIAQPLEGKTWEPPPTIRDQGIQPDCVAAAWNNWLESAPGALEHSPLSDLDLYHSAQLVDEWAGEAYEGTSVQAGARVLIERGLLSGVTYTQDVEMAAVWLTLHGPVVVSSPWYAQSLTRGNYIVPTDRISGYHAYECFAHNADVWTCRQSWGEWWGDGGNFYMTDLTMQHMVIWGAEFALPERALPLSLTGASRAYAG